MKNDSKNGSSPAGCGCGGCITLIAFFLLFWLICFGISVNGTKWNLDLLPPKIWKMDKPQADPQDPAPDAKSGAEPAGAPKTEDEGNTPAGQSQE